MAAARPASEPAVMAEMNTTPLIDVMLVLLIMFIITIPLQTHAVKIDLPSRAPPPEELVLDPVKNRIVITAGDAILWNGVPTTQEQLHRALEATTQLRPVPELHVQPEPEARYQRVDEVLAATKRAGVEKMGFVGNERYAAF